MQIDPSRIGSLSIIAITLYEHANMAINYNVNKAHEMHYVIDLLKDLVDTAYPVEEKTEDEEFQGPSFEVITITESTPFTEEQLERALENISKIAKNYKSPKAGEF